MIAALPPCPGSFEHLHASLSVESNAAFGTQFEELADWALWNSADWGPKIAKLQHWSAWAREQNAAARKKVYLEQDTGADRVITTVDGQTVIVQHKGFHDPDERVKMKDANNTLVLAETANADMVLFVYREDYYLASKQPADDHPDIEEWRQEMERAYGRAEVIVAKQRHGSTGKVRLKFDSRITKFSDAADDSFLPEARG